DRRGDRARADGEVRAAGAREAAACAGAEPQVGQRDLRLEPAGYEGQRARRQIPLDRAVVVVHVRQVGIEEAAVAWVDRVQIEQRVVDHLAQLRAAQHGAQDVVDAVEAARRILDRGGR